MLSVNNLKKSLANQIILDGISFDLGSGERVGIVGADEFDRSMLLRSISRIASYDSGSININSLNASTEGANSGTTIGVVFSEGDNLNTRMTLLQNIMYLSSLRGLRGSDCKSVAYNLLKRFKLLKYSNVEIKKIPIVQRNIAEIACAVAHEPAVVIIDRPEVSLSGLHPSVLCEMFDNSIDASSQCLMIVTQNMDYVSAICDRVILLNGGTILFDGPVGAFSENLYMFELRLLLPRDVLRQIENHMKGHWKKEKIFWEIEQGALVLNYSKAHQALTTLQWVQQLSDIPSGLTIENLPIHKAFRRFRY